MNIQTIQIMMKNLIYLSIFVLITSCSGIVDGLNDDPNNPTSAPYENILTGAEVGNIILQTGETARRAGIFAGYYTGIDRQHLGFSQYTVTTSDFDDLWDDAYVNTLRNAIVARQTAEEAGATGIVTGITQVIEALAIGTATSLYGDVPFAEAGDIDIENPVYEGQQSVYADLQLLLDEAIINLQSGTGRPPSGSDIYFDGDPAPWVEVANTLKARYYMHTKEYGNALSAAANGISGINNALYAPHETALESSNLSYQFFAVASRNNDLVTSDFMISLVLSDPAISPDISKYRGNSKTNEDGRYDFYFLLNTTGFQPNTLSGFAEQDAPAPIVTYEENLLILAEAAFRVNGFADGLNNLNAFRDFMSTGGYMRGVDLADVQYDTYVAADFANGGIENPDGVSQDDALLREILEERYITFFSQIEGFNDTRRTGLESVVRVPVMPNTGSQLPQRFIYPQSEIDRNSNTPDPIPDFFEPTPVNQ
jgi:hypothetical protein